MQSIWDFFGVEVDKIFEPTVVAPYNVDQHSMEGTHSIFYFKFSSVW